MSKQIEGVTPLYTEDGKLHHVVLSAEIWNKLGDGILDVLGVNTQDAVVLEEPMEDWKCLLLYWDFKYPPNAEVRCEKCGEETKDWVNDDPRKFTLKACNLGGLVRFQCLKCNTLILKRHFKDEIKVECTSPECLGTE